VKVRIGATGAATMTSLLRAIGSHSSVYRRMDRRDAEQIAWELRRVASDRWFPEAMRERAGYWAAYLEARR
jgi:hypothetical protein